LHDGLVISAVVFDLFGTLTGSEASRGQQIVELAEVLGAAPDALRDALRETYDERARGSLGDVREQLVALSARAGGSLLPEVIDRALVLRMSGQQAMLAPRPGAIEVLAALRERRLAIGVLSDCTDEIPILWSGSEYAPLVDCAVFSCEMGMRKPDPRMYQVVLEGLGTRPADALYVGDGGSSELTGALAAGLRSVLFRSRGDAYFRYDEEKDWRGETIEELGAVLALLY